jgi:hypothetical protein
VWNCERITIHTGNSYDHDYEFELGTLSPSIAKVVGHRSLDYILHYTEVRLAEEVLAGLRGP